MLKSVFLLLLTVILYSGCSENKKYTDIKEEEEKNYSVTIIDDKKISEIINNRMGKALFINVWATWCVPCVEEFPDIVKIAEHYRNTDVDVITLNVDMSSQIDSLVIPFLRSFNADLPVYNIREKSAENVINLLSDQWNGAIPATFIFDKNGEQKVFILGKEKFLNFRSAVDSVRSL
jgi:thiol-disulfide isomerase/thioredoxin